MQQPLHPGATGRTGPSFYLTGRQPLRPGAILLAVVATVGALSSVLYALGHNGRMAPGSGSPGADRSASATAGAAPGADNKDDKDDDPNQVDTIVLGDPTDAPTPGRRGDHVSPVHATILIRLPRYGDQVGLIPDSAAGHLLYSWLAAFNQASESALRDVLPNVASAAALTAQMELRQQSGGFNLLSAKEVEPGVLVFRLRDQTPEAKEVLGTLMVRPGSSPAAIGSFSLRGVASPRRGAVVGVAAQ